jgi:hypothetical protein
MIRYNLLHQSKIPVTSIFYIYLQNRIGVNNQTRSTKQFMITITQTEESCDKR